MQILSRIVQKSDQLMDGISRLSRRIQIAPVGLHIPQDRTQLAAAYDAFSDTNDLKDCYSMLTGQLKESPGKVLEEVV